MEKMKRLLKITGACVAVAIGIVLLGGFFYFRIRWHEVGIPRERSHVEMVSLISLIATPERFDQKEVMVEGICCLEFEGDALYLSKADMDALITNNAIWLDRAPLLGRTNELFSKWKFTRRPVRVIGVFSMNEKGHMGVFSGSLTNMTLIAITGRRGGG